MNIIAIVVNWCKVFVSIKVRGAHHFTAVKKTALIIFKSASLPPPLVEFLFRILAPSHHQTMELLDRIGQKLGENVGLYKRTTEEDEEFVQLENLADATRHCSPPPL